MRFFVHSKWFSIVLIKSKSKFVIKIESLLNDPYNPFFEFSFAIWLKNYFRHYLSKNFQQLKSTTKNLKYFVKLGLEGFLINSSASNLAETKDVFYFSLLLPQKEIIYDGRNFFVDILRKKNFDPFFQWWNLKFFFWLSIIWMEHFFFPSWNHF